MEKPLTNFIDFTSLDIRIGTIIKAEVFEKARKPAYKLWIDFGVELGTLKTSAQITERYTCKALQRKKVVAVVNFPKKQIADFMSECLVLGSLGEDGVSLLIPDLDAKNGEKVA
ncbi:MAG: tRNA-binding protein [Flavobacteriales bacterium]